MVNKNIKERGKWQTAFEKLLQTQKLAKEKKIKKASRNAPDSNPLEIIKLSSINNKHIRRKLQKKNLFDLESDDEEVQEIRFHANKELELERNEGFEIESPSQPQ